MNYTSAIRKITPIPNSTWTLEECKAWAGNYDMDAFAFNNQVYSKVTASGTTLLKYTYKKTVFTLYDFEC